MSKFSKKAASFGLIFAAIVFVSSMAPVQALTIAETQAQIDTLLAQIQTMQAQLGAQGAGTTSYTFTKNLTLGTTDAEVKTLQQFLNANGYIVSTSGAGSIGMESTYFGTKTKAALIAFQTAKGLTAIGFFGPLTRATIASMSTTAPVAAFPAGCTSAAGFSTTTGLSCATVTPVTTFPAGCTSAVGFSSTTGLSCAGAVAAIGAPLTATIASDTPVGANILAGSANNTVAKIVLTAGNDAAATVTGLTVKSYGTANLNALDIARVKIFDGTIQVGITQTQINGVSNFIFAPAISIAKGTSKTLSIVVDITATGVATPSATVKLGIESATKIIGATFGGTFPIIGNSHTIVAGGAIGTLVVTQGAPVASNNSYVGAKDVVMGNFIVTAGTNEDVKVNQMNISYGAGVGTGATITDSDISNIRIKVDNVVVGGPATFSTRRATVDFTAPITLTKGTSKVVTIIGDIASGATRIIELDNAVNSVNGMGITSNVGVTGGGPLAALGNVNRVTIAAGTLAISVSTASPAGSAAIVVRSITPQVLGVYDVRAVGEDIMINTVNLNFNTGNNAGAITGTINNVGLYDEAGALLSNQVTLTADQTTAVDQWQSGGIGVLRNAFAVNWLIPANTTKKLYIKGTTSTITAPNPAAVIVQLDAVTTAVAVNATGMSSSGIAGPNNININSNLALPALTINATATYLAVSDPTTSIYRQAIVAPAAQAVLGYLKVTAQNESQDLRQLEITNVPGVGAMNAMLSGVALFDGATQVTVFNAPNNGTAACLSGGANVNKVCFLNADIISPTTFTLNTPKVLKIVGNVLAAATEVNTLNLQVTAAEMQTIGKDSGALAVNAANINLLTNAGAYNETGTFGIRTNVVEITKDAASPSGSSRGTFTNHGIWDLSLNGTANTADIGSVIFTSQTGLPNVVGNPITAAMFRLYDYTNSAAIVAVADVNIAAGTVAFRGIPAAAIRITRGQVQKIALQVTTTNVAAWPLNTSLQWSIRSNNLIAGNLAGNMMVGPMGVAVALLDTDLAAANEVTIINNGAGNGELYVGSGGAIFNPAIHRAYIDVDGSTTVTAGDIRVWVTPGYAFPAGSTVVAGDADLGAYGAFAVAADQLVKNAAGADTVLVPGTDGLWLDVDASNTVTVGDIRLMPGNGPVSGLNYAGSVGYGGTTWSFPADANTVTLL